MSQEEINLLLGIVGIVGSSGTLLYIVQQFLQRKKNKADYGDDLLEMVNKSTASLKQTREDLAMLQQELRAADKEHELELEAQQREARERQEASEKLWKERQDRMRARVLELEKIIVKYDISFTLTTHPEVQVTDLKVISKEDVLASQKMRAIQNEDAKPKDKP